MGNEKLKIARTDANNLVSNLRGEVGEVITTWLLMRNFMGMAAQARSEDLEKDFQSRNLQFLRLMEEKLRDELVARLAELAEAKVGQLTFYFAARKLNVLMSEADSFSEFIRKNRLKEKRNTDISHKELPEHWSDHRAEIHIQYRTLVRAVVLALRLMKRIDADVLGRSWRYLWREARKRRYDFMYPPRTGYMMLPYLNLPSAVRVRLVVEELQAGRDVLSEVPTMINGHPGAVLACKEWGVIILPDGRLMPTDQYPLMSLASIEQLPDDSTPTEATNTAATSE